MNTTRTIRAFCAAVLSTVFVLALAPASRATTGSELLTYNVTLNVASLVSNPNGLFSLDLQLVPGSDNVSQTISISNFSVTAGSFTGSPNYTGGATGTTASTVVLTNSNASDDEFFQTFTAATTQISFRVAESNNQEVGGEDPTPDQFNVAILDNTTNNIPTTDPSGGNAMVSDAMVGSQNLSLINVNSSQSPDGGVTAVVAAPEPGSAALLLFGALGLCVRRRTLRRA